MLSKTSTQVVNALIILSRLPRGECEGARSIAAKINAPSNYLSKMLQSLCTLGILESQKGKGGGFRMKTDPNKLRLYDVVEPIDKVTVWEGCALGLKKCSDDNPCGVHHHWKQVREEYMQFLKTITIGSLT